MEKLLKKICQLNLKNNFFLILCTLSLTSCKQKEYDSLIFFGEDQSVCFDVYKKTKYKPSIRHTYVLQKNGNMYSFIYDIENEKIRFSDNKLFFSPEKWKIKSDSLYFENFYYKINFSSNSLFLTRKSFDTIWLKKTKNNFEINFLKKEKHYYIKNLNGDTISKSQIKEI